MNEYLLFRKNENFSIIDLYKFEVNNSMKYKIDYYFIIQKQNDMIKRKRRIIDNLLMQLKKQNKMMNIINDKEIEFYKIIINDYEY